MMLRPAALLATLALAGALCAATPDDCRERKRHGRMDQALACYLELTRAPSPLDRAEGYWGIEDYNTANDQFRLAAEQNPDSAHVKVRWGRMFLDYHQPADAAQLFQEAQEIENTAGALYGLALVASQGYEAKAIEFAQEAMKADPAMVEAQELLAFLALEDVNEQKATAEADKALKMSDEALDAMAIRATIDWLHDREDSPWIERILEINPVYGEAYALAGHFFVLNRRYEEGIEFYKKALELNPRLWDARTELGVNQMRLGLEREARENLEYVYYNGNHSEATRNTLKLLDSYENFVTYTSEKTIVRLHKKEAELLQPYFEDELQRAMRTYEKKYGLTLAGPVQLEVYPDHEDFAVRTMGMPGLGALGVTFGRMVAMDSPSSRPPGDFHWASTLWHELSHVFCLEATDHRVPRWFTEALAVHEETAADPEWGDRITPAVISAIKDDKLLPLAELDRGYIRPTYPAQVGVSYFQGGRICDYINERWGYDKLMAMMRAFGDKKDTRQVVREVLGMDTEQFDKDFLAWLKADLKPILDGQEKWQESMKALNEAASKGDHEQVIHDGPAARDLNPEYVEAGNAYELMARAHLARGNKPAATAEFERYMHAGGRNPELLKELAALQQEQGRSRDAAATLERINYIFPVQDLELHRQLGDLLLAQNETDAAIREFRAVVALNPLDRADSEFNLARAYQAAGRTEDALYHVVASLEAAPGFRPAQKLLLELSSADPPREQQDVPTREVTRPTTPTKED